MTQQTFTHIAILCFSVVVASLFATSLALGATGSVDVLAGNIYYAELSGTMNTLRWSGLIVQNTAVPLSDSKFPFLTGYSASFPGVVTVNFPGYNLNDEKHYYAAMFADEFDILNVQDVEPTDLEAGGMFSSSSFPIFYPNYYDFSDNPKETFTQGNINPVIINGVPFDAFNVTLGMDIEYYVLKYNYLGEDMPLFLVRFEDEVCVSNTPCKAEFMLPVSNRPYNFFILSEIPLFNFEIAIDEVPTTHFPQSAWAYLLWVRATDFYSGLPAPSGTNIFVREQNGNDLFIPYRLSGYVSYAMSVGQTDSNGEETFIIAPTIYPPINEYNITLGAIVDDVETSETDLYVDSFSPLLYNSKPLNPTTLYDNVKRAVNGLDAIGSALFTWQNPAAGPSKAKQFTIVYDTVLDTFDITQIGGGGPELRTGAPNLITVYVEANGVPQSGYSVLVEEQGGYLVMNPYASASPLTPKNRKNYQQIPQSSLFILTPTNYGSVNSQIALTILDSGGDDINSVLLPIDNGLNPDDGEGVIYGTDSLKRGINAIDAVIKSLFTTLNY